MHNKTLLLRAALTAALTLAAFSSAAAQDRPRPVLDVGARARVAAPVRFEGLRVKGSGRWITGTVRETTPTSVVLQTDPENPDSRIEVPYDVITAMEVSEGMTDARSSMLRGAGRGLMMGAAVTGMYVAGVHLFDDNNFECSEDPCDPPDGLFASDGGTVARNSGILLVSSALVGAALGSTAREKWTAVGAPGVTIGAAPGGGATLSLDIGF